MIEDELRRVLDRRSADAPPTTDRRGELGRRIGRRRRSRRTLVTLAAVLLLVAAGATIGLAERGLDLGPATPTGPGYLAHYASGGKLVATTSVQTRDRRVFTLRYTPKSWDFMVGAACADTTAADVRISVNGHMLADMQCDDAGATFVRRLRFDEPAAQFWHQQFDVSLGKPMTVEAELVQHYGPHGPLYAPSMPPLVTHGVASIGVYRNVAWSEFPVPAQPSGPATMAKPATPMAFSRSRADLYADNADPNAERSVSVVLTHDISIDVVTRSPGEIAVYVEGVQLEGCAVYIWYSGCRNGGLIHGTGDTPLTGFHVGQRVTLTVVPRHFTGAQAWQVAMFGR